MKNIERAQVVMGALVMMLAAGSAWAGPKGGGPAFGPEDGDEDPAMGGESDGPGPHMLLKALKGLADELDLTQAQRDSIKKIVADGREEISPLKVQARELREELHALLKAKKLDKAKIQAKHDEIQAVHQTIADIRFDMVLLALDVLSAEQRAELFGILEECKAKKGTGECKAMFTGKGKGKGKGKGPSF